jgi:ComF family protein
MAWVGDSSCNEGAPARPAQEFGAAQCRGGASRCQIRAQRRFTTTFARTARRSRGGARRRPPDRRGPPRHGQSSRDGSCGACLAHPPPFTATLAAHAYAFPVDRLLQALKYGGQIALGEWAGETLAARVRRDAPDLARASAPPLLVPLPLAVARQRQRGFNQAQLIAQALARALALPLAAALERTRAGPPQAALPWQARLGNVRGAFVARGRLDGLAVVLVDDVMTTGATLAAAATAVLAAGARRVDCWVVARTLPPGQS